MNKLVYPITILLAVVIASATYYLVEIKKEEAPTQSVIQNTEVKKNSIVEEVVETSTEEIITNEESAPIVEPVVAPVVAPAPTPAPTKPAEDLDMVLLRYKIDKQDIDEQMQILVDGYYKNKSAYCGYIINNIYDREHLWYIYLESYAGLKADYEKYRSKIEYIDNNLVSYQGLINMIATECSGYGYTIPTK